MGLNRDKIPSPQTTATAMFGKIEPVKTIALIVKAPFEYGSILLLSAVYNYPVHKLESLQIVTTQGDKFMADVEMPAFQGVTLTEKWEGVRRRKGCCIK